MTGKKVEKKLERFSEGNNIKCDTDSLAQIEGDADGPSDVQSEGAADDEIFASPFDAFVRRQFGNGQCGRDGHQVPQQNDQYRAD